MYEDNKTKYDTKTIPITSSFEDSNRYAQKKKDEMSMNPKQ